MRVLIVKASALGDIIHALPVIGYLHAVAPGVEVDWVVEEPFREILEGHPHISRLHTVRTKVWRKRPLAAATRREIGELRQALRERAYDLVFDIQGNLKSGVISWLTGCAHRIGFTRDELQESVNLLFTSRQVPVRPQDKHVTDKYLRVVSVPFGKDFGAMKLSTTIATSAEDDAVAETLLATLGDGLAFLFHYGTTWQTKFWTESGWVELGKQMLERYADSTILFSWGNDVERRAAAAIAARIGQRARLIDRYSLKGLVALLKKVDLVVGGDTGPIHMASEVGTPTVSLYRASDGRRSGPRGEQHRLVQAPMPCTACFKTRCERDGECRESITPGMVISEIESLFSSHGGIG